VTRDDDTIGLGIGAIHSGYLSGKLRVADLIDVLVTRIEARGGDGVWISRVDRHTLRQRVRGLEAMGPVDGALLQRYPLYGIPFAVKDNIDVAGLETTAACPAFAYEAADDAEVVWRLLGAGAVLIGKTNLDQFATGLVGTRSPYGVPVNAVNPDYIPGGSSSGSAVAVAAGLVSFALGTDTAGSGRVPAALNGIVGIKPTPGLLSTRGLVPACRSLDCVSVFAASVEDARFVTAVCAGFDAADPFSRPEAAWQRLEAAPPPSRFRFAVPRASQLEFFGDEDSHACFDKATARLGGLGGEKVEVDFGPFREAAGLLYDGPWVAERLVAAGALLRSDASALDPDVRAAIERAHAYGAADAFAGLYRLHELRRAVAGLMAGFDCLVVPTAGRPYRLDEVRADPQGTNANLGYYTNFVNLLDLCAVSVPAEMLPQSVPFGITLIGPAFADSTLCALGALFSAGEVEPRPATPTGGCASVRLCVSGAHMSGLALNGQLLENRGQLVSRTRTAPRYQLYAFTDMSPPRPGMVRADDGVAVDVEVWELPKDRLGWLMSLVPPPLCIGTVELESGESVKGFLCESSELGRAEDISGFGGWRAYLGACGSEGPGSI
jgi:allophanate hydrolase